MRLPHGYRVEAIDETPSTNADALEAARQGEESGLWIMARVQTAGRGSRGRGWESPQGNLYASLLLRDPAPVRHLPEMTFVVSLAVRNAIAGVAREQRVVRDISLKWPNDILVGGRKVSGILLESHELAGQGRVVIAGIGVNVANHPADALHRASDLGAEGMATDPAAMLERIASEIDKLLRSWDRGLGFAAIREEWLAQATGIGERIFVKMPGRELSGTFEDLDENGMLCLLLDDGSTVRVSVADIFFANAI